MMDNVLTLVGDPAAAPLGDADARNAATAIVERGGVAGTADWLAPGIACDIPFDGVTPQDAHAAVRAALAGDPVDIVAQKSPGRRKRLLVADMESTIIENEMLDELAAACGIGEAIADITARAMAGELDFEGAIRARVDMLKGLDANALEDALAAIRITAGAATLVATMRANGAYCALVSGGFLYFTRWVRQRLGFDYDQANRLEIVDGKLAGTVTEPILGRDAKREALLRLSAERALSPQDAITVGDGANDLAMLEAAGLGIAFRAKPIVAERARARIDHGDLTALLYLQGYRQSEFRA
jgi:phosphoserine phosphatase